MNRLQSRIAQSEHDGAGSRWAQVLSITRQLTSLLDFDDAIKAVI